MKIDFITIFTNNISESIDFYSDILGFTVTSTVDAGNGVTLVFLTDGNGGNIELIDQGVERPAAQNCPVALTIKVDSIEMAIELTTSKEITPALGPKTMENGIKILHIKDPSGVTINFVELPEPH